MMRSTPISRRVRALPLCALACALLASAPSPAHALRIVTWNLLTYPNNLPQRQPSFRTVMANINAAPIAQEEVRAAGGYRSDDAPPR